jgi:hypothetical protein
MAKKTDTTTNPAAPEKRAAKPATVAAKTNPAVVAAKTNPSAVTAKIKPAAKAAKAPAAKAKRAAKAPARAKPRYTREDVARRAYFISEKRRAHGLPGDEHQDWIEAERQILAEGTKPKEAKKA